MLAVRRRPRLGHKVHVRAYSVVSTPKARSKKSSPKNDAVQETQNHVNSRDYIQSLAQTLEITTPESWYSKLDRDILKADATGRKLLSENNSLLSKILDVSEALPGHTWNEWEFTNASTPANFWDDPARENQFFEWMMRKHNMKSLSDWYKISIREFRKEAPSLAQLKYGCSIIRFLRAVRPEHEWLEWNFSSCPSGFWNMPQNRIKYIHWVSKQLKIKKMEDWYNVKGSELRKLRGGAGIVRHSFVLSLREAYPNHDWLEWRFPIVPPDFWNNRDNQLRFIEWAGRKLGYKTLDHWYGVSREKLVNLGGNTLVYSTFGGSVFNCLQAVYPEHNWIPWKFNSVPQGFWEHPSSAKAFLDWAGEQLGVKGLDDWGRIKREQIVELGGGHMLNLHGWSIRGCLKIAYPEHAWSEEALYKSSSFSQRMPSRIFEEK